MLAIAGASGQLGFATLNALLDHKLIPPADIVCTTSSETGAKKLESAKQKGVRVISAHWDDAASYEKALQGCDKLFLISSSRIHMDFGNAPPGDAREADHFTALGAAFKAGVKHIYYTSLAFNGGGNSKSRVMEAHERTEEWLAAKCGRKGIDYTIIREGIYNESWPLYLGHYSVLDDERSELVVAGDGKISWTSIADLGLANALILAAPSEDWAHKDFYLSQKQTYTLQDVAKMVSKAKGAEVKLKVVSRDEHDEYYVNERSMDEGMVKWWSKTFDALESNEGDIDDPTLEKLSALKGVKAKKMEETVEEMLKT